MISPPCHLLLIADADSDLFARVCESLGTPEVHAAPASDAATQSRCDQAASQADGLRAMSRNAHDVYLLDQTQGGDRAGGFALLRRALKHGCRRPVILLTTEAEAEGEGLASGAVDCLPKSELNAFTLGRAVRWALERETAVRSLRESERLLVDFLENVPASVSIKDLAGRYLFINETGRRAFRDRVPADGWLGRADAEIWPTVAPELRQADLRVIESGQPVESARVIDVGGGRLTHWQMHGFPVRDSTGRVRAVGGVSLDITARVQQAAAERERAQMLAAIAAHVPVIAGRIDEDGMISEAIGTLIRGGNDAAYLLGKNVFVHWPEHAAMVRRALAGEPAHLDWSGVLYDRVLHLESHLFFDTEKGRGAIFFSRDISEHRQLQNQVLEISDAEQRRLGQDLHDGLGQHLAGISYLAGALAHGLAARQAPEAAEAHGIVTLLGEAMSLTRELAWGLSPVDLKSGDFVRALENLAAGVEKMFGVRCEVSLGPGTASLLAGAKDGRAVTHLYRIAQEATTNAVRHGRARHLRLELQADPALGEACLTISDDGVGLPRVQPASDAARRGAAAPAERGGLGLRVMDHRAGSLGGRLQVFCNPAGGASVCCTFPLRSLTSGALPAESQSQPRS